MSDAFSAETIRFREPRFSVRRNYANAGKYVPRVAKIILNEM